MPRDSSGNYTLPIGNPVVDGTIIDVNWANPTMSDIAVQLNNVLTRDGLLGPTDAMYFVDGTVALPGIAFAAANGTGIWRTATAIGVSWQGSSKQFWGAGGTQIDGNLNVTGNANIDGTVEGQLRFTAAEPISLQHANGFITWRLNGTEEPPGIALGRIGNTAVWRGLGGVSIENNTGGIQFFGANFCPQIDGSVNLGVPTFRWNQLFTLAAAIGTTTVDFAQYKLEVGTGMRVIGNNGIRLINSNVDGGGGIAPGAGAGGGLGITGDAGPLTFGAGGLERMRIDTAGNVGIGDSPPVNTLSIMGNSSETTVGGRAKSIVFNNFTQTGGGGNDIVWQAANTATMRWAAISGQITSNSGATAGGQLLFSTGAGAGLLPRMTIDAVGNVLFGTSFNNFPTLILDGFSGGRPVVAFKRSGTQIWGTYMNTDAGPGTDPYCISTPSETIGQRLSSTVSGSWQTMSDERIKTDLLSITDALNKVASLRAITYRLIDGPTPERSVGLIAQDVQAVLPEAVSPGIVGSVNGVGGVERLWLSYTAVIPLLVAAIKELNAKVDAL